MTEIRNKTSFEKAFKKSVHNFDETKIWFEHPSRGSERSKICFVLEGNLRKFPMYKSSNNIELWANHFIEFLETGKWDYNAYWRIYKNKPEIMTGDILKFPMCEISWNYFYEHSPEMNAYLYEYRNNYGDCGIRLVPKPLVEIRNV